MKKFCFKCGETATRCTPAKSGERFEDLVGTCDDHAGLLSGSTILVESAVRFFERKAAKFEQAVEQPHWRRIIDLRPETLGVIDRTSWPKALRPTPVESTSAPAVSFSCRLATA